jgi:hypothetical protein
MNNEYAVCKSAGSTTVYSLYTDVDERLRIRKPQLGFVPFSVFFMICFRMKAWKQHYTLLDYLL